MTANTQKNCKNDTEKINDFSSFMIIECQIESFHINNEERKGNEFYARMSKSFIWEMVIAGTSSH